MKRTLDEVLDMIANTPTVLPTEVRSGDPVTVYADKNRKLIIDQIKQRWDQ